MEGTGLTPIPRIFYSGSGAAADRPAAASLRNGSLWFSTDILDIDQVIAGAWVTIFDASTIRVAHHGNHETGGVDEMDVTDLGGVLADPQNPVTHSHLTVAETEVYNAAAPTSWTDLDLSGIIGSNEALVLLKFIGDGSTQQVKVRQNGDTADFSLSEFSTANHVALWVTTDASGIIEWKAVNTDNTTIDVIGYIV